jgi:hypothetical protein
MKPFSKIAIFIFALVTLLHILRLSFGWEVAIGGIMIPMWASLLGLLVAEGLAVMLWCEIKQ